jgi:hypothetical protein
MMQTESGLTRNEIEGRVRNSTPKAACEDGHDIGRMQTLIQVEWLGENGYLT